MLSSKTKGGSANLARGKVIYVIRGDPDHQEHDFGLKRRNMHSGFKEPLPILKKNSFNDHIPDLTNSGSASGT
jgi:hypothetical protein